MVYDVAVVGAGPAGSTFARIVAQNGFSVVIINGQTESRPKLCGGLLAPDAQKLFAHFDFTLPNDVLADPQIFSVKTVDLVTERIRYYPRYYLNMDRYRFDSFLMSLLPDSVDVINGRCESIEKNELFCLSVSTDSGKTTVCAKRIVGADGASSIVRRSFFKGKLTRYVAIQETYSAETERAPFYSCIFDRNTSEACSWMMFKNDRMIYGGAFKSEGCREAFDKQKKRAEKVLRMDFGTPLSREACLVVRPKRWKDFKIGKNGVWLIGEAAGFISASSFEGISSAIISGSMLAEAFLKGKNDKAVSRIYSRLVRPLKRKLWFKIVKRWFMYTHPIRNAIMLTGITSIKIKK